MLFLLIKIWLYLVFLEVVRCVRTRIGRSRSPASTDQISPFVLSIYYISFLHIFTDLSVLVLARWPVAVWVTVPCICAVGRDIQCHGSRCGPVRGRDPSCDRSVANHERGPFSWLTSTINTPASCHLVVEVRLRRPR